jgi:hypothetical protein
MAAVTPTSLVRLLATFHADAGTDARTKVATNAEVNVFAGAFEFSAGKVSIKYGLMPSAMSSTAARFIAWVGAQSYIQVVSRGTAESGTQMQDYAKEKHTLLERVRFLEAKADAAEAAAIVAETRLQDTEAVNTRLRRENGDCMLLSDLTNKQQADKLNQLQMDNNRLLRMEILRGEEAVKLQADIAERDRQTSGMAAHINRITRVNTQLDATNSALVVANATLTNETRSAKGGGSNAIASVLKSTVDLIAAGVSAVSPTSVTNAVNSAGEAVGRLLKRKRED